MNGLPIEVILLLLFGIATVLNFLKRRAANKKRAAAASNAPPQEEEIPEEIWREQPAAQRPRTAADILAKRRAEVPAVTPARPQRRFDRQTLLGSRRKVQDAFVLATIVGRCRADEPHEIR